jgi:hypothetical protein
MPEIQRPSDVTPQLRLSPALEAMLNAEPGPPDGTPGVQVAWIWRDRVVRVRFVATDTPPERRTLRQWGPLLVHERPVRSMRAHDPRPEPDQFPLFVAGCALLAAPLAALCLFTAQLRPQVSPSPVPDPSSRWAAWEISPGAASGVVDPDRDAGAGVAQAGEGGQAGVPEDVGEGQARKRASAAPEQPGDAAPLGMAHHPDTRTPLIRPPERRWVAEVEPGLGPYGGGIAHGTRDSQGEQQAGVGGQLREGAGASAGGDRDVLAGLSLFGSGKGASGSGFESGYGLVRGAQPTGPGWSAWVTVQPRAVDALVEPASRVLLEADTQSFERAVAAVSAGERVDLIRPEDFVNAVMRPLPNHDGPDLVSELALDPAGDRAWLWVGGASSAGEPPDVPLDLVLLLDDSCSMVGSSRYDVAVDAARQVVDGLQSTDRVAVWRYSSYAHSAAPWSAPAGAHAALSDTPAAGNSPLFRALEAVVAAHPETPGRHTHVVLFADGETAEMWTQWLEAWPSHLSLTVLSVGADSVRGSDHAEKLALATGGRSLFLHEASSADLLNQRRTWITHAAPILRVDFEGGVQTWRLIGNGARTVGAVSQADGQGEVMPGQVGWASQASVLYELTLDGAPVQIHASLSQSGTVLREHDVAAPVAFAAASQQLHMAWAAARVAEQLIEGLPVTADYGEVLQVFRADAQTPSDRALLGLMERWFLPSVMPIDRAK